MKKLFLLIAVLTLTLTLTGCGEKEVELPDEMTMAELDEYLGREDVQYVDLRNFDEKLISGYIQGFESIPYFDYLKYQGILVDDGGWVYDAGEIKSSATMKAIFNEDKTILLMCGSGTRAQYVMDALLSLGYENVINIGGYAEYVTADGENVVLGGSPFIIDLYTKGDYTPGTYFGASDDLYTATVVINPEGGIQSVFFDAVTCTIDADEDGTKESGCTTKQTQGDAYNMVTYGGAGQEWYMQANELAGAIVAAQGFDASWTIVEDHFDGVDAVSGVTISVGGFEAALEAALLQAE